MITLVENSKSMTVCGLMNIIGNSKGGSTGTIPKVNNMLASNANCIRNKIIITIGYFQCIERRGKMINNNVSIFIPNPIILLYYRFWIKEYQDFY